MNVEAIYQDSGRNDEFMYGHFGWGEKVKKPFRNKVLNTSLRSGCRHVLYYLGGF